MSGILGNKKNPLSGKSTNKRLVPMPRQLNKHLLNPVSVLFIWQSLFQKSGSLAYTIARIGECPQNGAGDRHDDLPPNHCSPEGDNGIVGDDAPRHRHPVEVGRRIRILDAFHLFHSASPDSQGMYHVPLVIKLSLQSSQFSSTRPP